MWNSLQVLYAIFMSLCKITKKLILLSTKQVALRVEQRATPQRPLCVCVFLHVHINCVFMCKMYFGTICPAVIVTTNNKKRQTDSA